MKIPLLYGLYEYLTNSPPKMAANLMDILTSGNYVLLKKSHKTVQTKPVTKQNVPY